MTIKAKGSGKYGPSCPFLTCCIILIFHIFSVLLYFLFIDIFSFHHFICLGGFVVLGIAVLLIGWYTPHAIIICYCCIKLKCKKLKC